MVRRRIFFLSLDIAERYPLDAVWREAADFINDQFVLWLRQNFAGLIYSPYLPQPVMVHHIPHFLAARHIQDKIALIELLDYLWNKGFITYITSDHGNIEARGVGRPAEGVFVATAGERMRLYSDIALLKSLADSGRGWEWSNAGLPPEVYVMLANSREAFVNQGELVVAHGGVSLPEVVVPFVRYG